MINTKYLSQYFTNLLNKYGEGYGKHFRIFADEGELKAATKEYGKAPIEYTSGIVEILSSQLTPIRDIRLNTYSAQITLFIDLALNGFNEDKESYNFMDIRDVITNIISEENGKTDFVKVNNIEFNQTISYGYPTNGTKSDVGFISDCMPIYISCNIALFEGGVNANECDLYVNGEKLSFTRLVFTRNRTADSQTFNGDKSEKTTIQSQGLSVDFVVPALKYTETGKLFMEDVLNGGNYALNVTIETPLAKKTFIGTFGNTSASLDIATNIGYNLSIVEGKENLLDYEYNPKWKILNAKDNNFSIFIKNAATIYWGDGNVENVEPNKDNTQKEITHIYIDGKATHTIRIFGG